MKFDYIKHSNKALPANTNRVMYIYSYLDNSIIIICMYLGPMPIVQATAMATSLLNTVLVVHQCADCSVRVYQSFSI